MMSAAMNPMISPKQADRLLSERNQLMHSFGDGPWQDGRARDRIRAIEIELYEGGILGVDPRDPDPAPEPLPWPKVEPQLRLLIGQPRRVSFFGLLKSTIKHLGRLHLHLDVIQDTDGKILTVIPVFAGPRRPAFMRSKDDVARNGLK